ncbi:hypothetical protein PHYSODRAFT_294770 [Phytophthora sojae]|uniref:Uncharacterized protein n=1 Tax=Phytophthora sojae (strain P6497) TaxID=1094619 RepID=G4YL15_PHYSP|nr:hypothetical protein PHYSODRAFT_294770 [Phytophthora sojae]EGZ29770.1 hypothetical protein PHYSODRAFT_294770 [Phytophthora sojae]|eukprot:XP_009517045.1 hypothetical protein PHYSODRAFT_294770 [Phytophthora sojae]
MNTSITVDQRCACLLKSRNSDSANRTKELHFVLASATFQSFGNLPARSMTDDNSREHKRGVDTGTDPWAFLSPWLEQPNERLMVLPDGYFHWRTREVLELLVLAHAVNNQALIKILREKCALRFANEEDIFDVNYADEEDDTSRRQSDVTAKRQLFKFDCKRDRLCRLASFLALIWATKTPGSCKVERCCNSIKREDTSLHFADGSNIVTKRAISISVDTNRKLLSDSTGGRWGLIEAKLVGNSRSRLAKNLEELSINTAQESTDRCIRVHQASAMDGTHEKHKIEEAGAGRAPQHSEAMEKSLSTISRPDTPASSTRTDGQTCVPQCDPQKPTITAEAFLHSSSWTRVRCRLFLNSLPLVSSAQ